MVLKTLVNLGTLAIVSVQWYFDIGKDKIFFLVAGSAKIGMFGRFTGSGLYAGQTSSNVQDIFKSNVSCSYMKFL